MDKNRNNKKSRRKRKSRTNPPKRKRKSTNSWQFAEAINQSPSPSQKKYSHPNLRRILKVKS